MSAIIRCISGGPCSSQWMGFAKLWVSVVFTVTGSHRGYTVLTKSRTRSRIQDNFDRIGFTISVVDMEKFNALDKDEHQAWVATGNQNPQACPRRRQGLRSMTMPRNLKACCSLGFCAEGRHPIGAFINRRILFRCRGIGLIGVSMKPLGAMVTDLSMGRRTVTTIQYCRAQGKTT